MAETSYPEKTCEIDRLVTQEALVQATLEGRKTQQRRNGVYAYPDEEFELNGITFEVTRVFRQTLGDITDEDAAKEGYEDLDTYRESILGIHGGMTWDAQQKVWVHEFRRKAS